jgi:hypothetical protein
MILQHSKEQSLPALNYFFCRGKKPHTFTPQTTRHTLTTATDCRKLYLLFTPGALALTEDVLPMGPARETTRYFIAAI